MLVTIEEVERLTAEVERLTRERDMAQAACAEMLEDFATLAMAATASHNFDCDCELCKISKKDYPGALLLERLERLEQALREVDADLGGLVVHQGSLDGQRIINHAQRIVAEAFTACEEPTDAPQNS